MLQINLVGQWREKEAVEVNPEESFFSQTPEEKKGSPKLVLCPSRDPAQVST